MTNGHPTLWMRARFALLEWLCPKCRKFNLSRVSYDTGYLIRCKGRLCKAEWVIGHTLRPYHLKGIHPAWPSDIVFKPEWRDGEPVNEIVPSQVDGNDEPETCVKSAGEGIKVSNGKAGEGS